MGLPQTVARNWSLHEPELLHGLAAVGVSLEGPLLLTIVFRAQGAPGALGEFDMSSGCCLATAELRSTPSNVAYSMDGRLLVVLLKVTHSSMCGCCLIASYSPLMAPSGTDATQLQSWVLFAMRRIALC